MRPPCPIGPQRLLGGWGRALVHPLIANSLALGQNCACVVEIWCMTVVPKIRTKLFISPFTVHGAHSPKKWKTKSSAACSAARKLSVTRHFRTTTSGPYKAMSAPLRQEKTQR